jgi:hypothetical protein
MSLLRNMFGTDGCLLRLQASNLSDVVTALFQVPQLTQRNQSHSQQNKRNEFHNDGRKKKKAFSMVILVNVSKKK